MSAPQRPAESDDPRVYFAAERTLLAWIRTSLALMGFGFIVARFGITLREAASSSHLPVTSPSGFSLGLGTFLILLGVLVTAWAAYKHHQWVRKLRAGDFQLPRTLSLVTFLAWALSLAGLIVIGFLLFELASH